MVRPASRLRMKREAPVHLRISFALLTATCVCTEAWAQTEAVLVGRVEDGATGRPLAGVEVSASSPALLGKKTEVTDGQGQYRLSQLPPGSYALSFSKEGHFPATRPDILLHAGSTLRVSVSLFSEGGPAAETVVVGTAPSVDVGSGAASLTVTKDFIERVPLIPLGQRGSQFQSVESLALIAPGAHQDAYGVSMGGTTSPENLTIVDGMTVNNPAYGVGGTPVSAQFAEEVTVITGGYMPEYGRSAGGVLNVVTKSGSNALRGSVFASYLPGGLAALPPATAPEQISLSTTKHLSFAGTLGGEVAGPILKDKLWFYAGIAPTLYRQELIRDIDALGRDGSGRETRTRIPEGREKFRAQQQQFQYLGKLTFLADENNTLALSVLGTPTRTGSPGTLGMEPIRYEVTLPFPGMVGRPESVGFRTTANAFDTSLKWSSSLLDKRLLLDAVVGWHHEFNDMAPLDGSDLGAASGVGGDPSINWSRTDVPHTLEEFETLNPATLAKCQEGGASRCPVREYFSGGRFFYDRQWLNRYQGRLSATYLFSAAGKHALKAGFDLEGTTLRRINAFGGNSQYFELLDPDAGQYILVGNHYGYFAGPGQPVFANRWDRRTRSLDGGLFLQDSWNILEYVTVNAGIRYDTQTLYGSDDRVALKLPSQISPRVGLVYDFTRKGRGKVFGSYARYYQAFYLNAIDQSFPSQGLLQSVRPVGPGCQPGDTSGCAAQGQYSVFQAPEKAVVDPDLKPQSSDEFLLGAEYEILPKGRLGASYTRRRLVDAIEDVSRDQGLTYVVVNPGRGIASDFEKAVRNYDAVTVWFSQSFHKGWLAQASYTWSRLYGNYSGLFLPEQNFLAPNSTPAFDERSLLVNQTGLLPGDRTHSIKIFGARELALGSRSRLSIGLAYHGFSGEPMSYLGLDPNVGSKQVYILPRGAAGRTDWITQLDAHIGYQLKLGDNNALRISLDIFNLLNRHSPITRDEEYTSDPVAPLQCGSRACNTSDLERLNVSVNPNFRKPLRYQDPRAVRFNARLDF